MHMTVDFTALRLSPWASQCAGLKQPKTRVSIFTSVNTNPEDDVPSLCGRSTFTLETTLVSRRRMRCYCITCPMTSVVWPSVLLCSRGHGSGSWDWARDTHHNNQQLSTPEHLFSSSIIWPQCASSRTTSRTPCGAISSASWWPPCQPAPSAASQ